MQTDGNLVLYDTSGSPKWSSGTDNNPGAFLDVQDDKNLVIYPAGTEIESLDNAIWNRYDGIIHNPPPSPQTEQILAIYNQYRAANNLPPLAFNSELMASAQGHSDDMAKNNLTGHTGSDGSGPFDRIPSHFSARGENVYAGPPTAQACMAGWYNETPPNDGHRQNILSTAYNVLGVGYSTNPDPTTWQFFWCVDYAHNP